MQENKCFLCDYSEKNLILTTKKIYVISDIAPLENGHILISPKEHYYSFSSVQGELIFQTKLIKEECKRIIFKQYFKETIFFEHGVSNNCSFCETKGCGVNHSHIHAVPIKRGKLVFGVEFIEFLKREALMEKIEIFRVDNYEDILEMKDKNYLYVEDINQDKKIIYMKSGIPSQILRKYVSIYLENKFDYNWERFLDYKSSNTTKKY